MSALADILLRSVDPLVVAMFVGTWAYLRHIEKRLRSDVAVVRERLARVEDTFIPDGGALETAKDNDNE